MRCRLGGSSKPERQRSRHWRESWLEQEKESLPVNRSVHRFKRVCCTFPNSSLCSCHYFKGAQTHEEACSEPQPQEASKAVTSSTHQSEGQKWRGGKGGQATQSKASEAAKEPDRGVYQASETRATSMAGDPSVARQEVSHGRLLGLQGSPLS